MKKLLILLFSLIISFNSYGGWFDKTICVETGVRNIDGILYLLKKTKPFTGKNLCEYDNGQNKSKGKVKDGKIDDKWTYWFENGRILKEENYKEGKKNGKWTWWNENGQILLELNYKYGELVSKTNDAARISEEEATKATETDTVETKESIEKELAIFTRVQGLIQQMFPLF